MNILFYQHQYPAFGGIETVTTILANRFAKDGHRVCIVSFVHKEGSNLLGKLVQGIEWRELPEPYLDSPSNRSAFLSILVAFQPAKIIFQDSYANIHDMLFDVVEMWRNNYCLPSLVPEELSAPCLSCNAQTKHRHEIGLLRRLAISILRPYLYLRRFYYESCRRKLLFDKSDCYVVLSGNYFSQIRRLVGKKRMQKLCAIPNPIVGETYSANIVKKKTILFVGSLITTKGVERLLQVWAIIEKKYPCWIFKIVGDGPKRMELEEMARRIGLQQVSFEGFQKDPTPYYKEASVFVMASNFEGWPMVLGEAMRQGCVPVVFNSFASASDIVEDFVSGFLIKPFDKKQFAKRLECVMKDEDMRMKMARSAIAKTNEYCLDGIVAKWYSLLSRGARGVIVVEHNSPFGRF